MTQRQIYRLSILFLFISTFACEQKPNIEEEESSREIKVVVGEQTTTNEIEPSVIYRSKDLGNTWSTFANGIPSDATLSGIQQHNNKLYVSTDYHGVFVSKDGQNQWTAINKERLRGLDINCIELDESHMIIGTLKSGILFSNDQGVNWQQAKLVGNPAIRAFIRDTEILYAGTDAGIYESRDDGETWSHAFGQMQILGFTSLSGKFYAAAHNGALMQNTNTWAYIYNKDALHDIGNDGSYIYAMTIGQKLLKTNDDGASWEMAQNGITYPANFYSNELQHIGNDVFSAQWIGIYRSSDNGNNWSMLDGLPDSTAFSTLAITDFGIVAGVSIR